MILPIVAYGDPVLKKVGEEIDKDYPDLQELVDNMFETMYNAQGVGLAAPQIGRAIRLFVIDSEAMIDEDDPNEEKGLKQVFINAEIVGKDGKKWAFSEGCLSIPKVREDVVREEAIRIHYYDRDFNFHDEVYYGMTARVIMHEYDHIEGILFTDYLKPLKKRLLKRRLDKISKGDISVGYKMRFPKK